MGIANTDRNVRLSATILSQTPPAGHVAFLTQSGALGASIIDFAGELDVGFSVVASLGNMASINPCDLLPMQFLDWFVKEQGEEEKNAEDLIKKYKLFGQDPKGLYMLDNELKARVYAAPSLVI